MEEQLLTQNVVEQKSETLLIAENESRALNYQPCVYLDRTKSYRGTELQIAYEDTSTRLPNDTDNSPEGNLNLPEIGKDVIVKVKSRNEDSFYKPASDLDLEMIPSHEMAEAKVATGADAPIILEKIAPTDAQEDVNKGTALVGVEEVRKVKDRFGSVSKKTVEKSRWQDRKEKGERPSDYVHHKWVIYEGYANGEPQLKEVKQVNSGDDRQILLDIPPLDVSLTSDGDTQFQLNLILKVPSSHFDEYKYYRFPLDKPAVRDAENSVPYGFLKELNQTELERMGNKGTRIVEPGTLVDTWNNFGRVDRETISWQLIDWAESSLSDNVAKVKTDREQKIDVLKKGIEKYREAQV